MTTAWNIILATHIIGILLIGWFIITMDVLHCLVGLALVMISDIALVLADVKLHGV